MLCVINADRSVTLPLLYTGVGKIPPDIGWLRGLTILDLSYNSITGKSGPVFSPLSVPPDHTDFLGSIPPELGQLLELSKLLLNNNQLSGPIPPELGNLLELERLCLSDNLLTGSIPSSFKQLSKLGKLELLNLKKLKGIGWRQ